MGAEGNDNDEPPPRTAAASKSKAMAAFVSPAIPASASVGDLLDYLGDQQTRRRAAKRLLKEPEQVPEKGLVSLLEATCRLGNTSGCQKLLAMLRAMGTTPDPALYETLLKLSNNRFTWDLSLALLHEAEQEDGLALSPAMLGATLYCCLQADRPHEAVKLLERFHRHGAKPTLPLLMTLIQLLSEKGMVPALRAVGTALASLEVDGDAALYTTLVAAFGRAGSYDDVVASAMLVEGKGVADKGRIYSTAVAALLEGGLLGPAQELYQRALKDGAEISRKGYEVLVNGAALSSDPTLAIFFLYEMKQAAPDEPVAAKVYWRPISACLRAQRLAEAAELVVAYYCEVEGTASDPVPLNNLVKATCESRRAEDKDLAVRVFEEIQERRGAFVGNSFTSMVLIGAYRRAQAMDMIVGVHQAMLQAGVDVWLPAASNVMYAYAKIGAVDTELEVFKALAASPAQVGLVGTTTGGKGAAKKDAAPLPQKEKNLFLWERLLSRAMYLAAQHHRLDTATLVLGLLQKHPGLKATGPTDYMNLIKAFSHAHRPGDALQVLLVMNQRKGEGKPSTLHYNAVLHAFCRVDRLADAETVFDDMKMRQVPLDAATFNILIAGFERARQPDRALALYEEMKRRGIQADAYVLNSLISVTADVRNRTMANTLLQRFRKLAGDPEEESNDVTFGAFMHALAKADMGSRREALALLETFKASGRTPNTIMYNEALYVTYRLVRDDPAGMGDKALALYHEMLGHGEAATPTTLTYRRLFKCLKQARRFQEIVDVAAPLPRDLLVTHDRLGIPVIAASLRVGQPDRARDLLGDLVLKPNTTYATYRWAAFVYCTKLDPPDLAAAETVLGLVEEQGWKADRGMYSSLLRGCLAAKQIEKAFDLYHNLPPSFQGGDPAAVAALCHMDRGRLDRVAGLLQVMRQYEDIAGPDLLVKVRKPSLGLLTTPTQPTCTRTNPLTPLPTTTPPQMLELLLQNQDYGIALKVVELMLDHDLTLTRPQHRHVEALVMANPKGPALDVLEGLSMLSIMRLEDEDDAVVAAAEAVLGLEDDDKGRRTDCEQIR